MICMICCMQKTSCVDDTDNALHVTVVFSEYNSKLAQAHQPRMSNRQLGLKLFRLLVFLSGNF